MLSLKSRSCSSSLSLAAILFALYQGYSCLTLLTKKWKRHFGNKCDSNIQNPWLSSSRRFWICSWLNESSSWLKSPLMDLNADEIRPAEAFIILVVSWTSSWASWTEVSVSWRYFFEFEVFCSLDISWTFLKNYDLQFPVISINYFLNSWNETSSWSWRIFGRMIINNKRPWFTIKSFQELLLKP